MGYLSIGYYTVCLSPLFSLFVRFFASYLPLGTKYGWLIPIIVSTGVHALVIGIQVCGIFLYIVGYVTEKGEARELVPFTLFFSILLILWGLLVSLVASAFYSQLIPWSKMPGMRELTIWDHLEYATWTLKGLLWTASGLIFIVTSYMWEWNW